MRCLKFVAATISGIRRRQARLDLLAVRRLRHHREEAVGSVPMTDGSTILNRQPVAELRDDPAHGLVSPLVAAEPPQDRRDVLDDRLYAERVGDAAG